MENSKKYNMLYLVVLILAIIIMFIGMTVTYFALVSKDKDDSTEIRTGTLSINYVDGKTINAHDLYPINEPGLNDELYVYKKNFSITSDGTLDQNMDIYIDITNNEFVQNHLMYALYEQNGNKVASNAIPKEGKVLLASNVFLKSGETKSYTVILWLKETGENQNIQQDCHFTGKFDIIAQQIKYN